MTKSSYFLFITCTNSRLSKSTYGKAKKLSLFIFITFPTKISGGKVFVLPLVNSKSPTLGIYSSLINELVKYLPSEFPVIIA